MSFGGLIAYEIAGRLKERGETVGVVALFDTINVSRYRSLPLDKKRQFRRTYLTARMKKYGQKLLLGRSNTIATGIYELVSKMRNRLLLRSALLANKVMRRSLPKRARTHIVFLMAAAHNYIPKPFAGRLILFRAEGRMAEYSDDFTLGWGELAWKGVAVHPSSW